MEIRSIDVFLEYWGSVRKRTMRVVDLVPEDQLEWTYAAARWTFGDIIRHLAGIERDMYAETVAGRPSRYPGHGRDLAEGRDAVMAYFTDKDEEARAIFAALTPERLAGKAITPAGTSITTWKWLRAMVEHEAHHRGQLYLMLGMLGVATPTLYGLTEEEVHARSTRA